MKKIYIQKNGVRYSITINQVETNSNYDTSIHVTKWGDTYPICGTIIKSTDDPKKIAKQLLKNKEK